MTDEIRVTVCKYPDRANLVLRYIDPVSGKQKTKSAGTGNEAEATKAAGKWEDELRSGRFQSVNRLTWGEFRRRYETEKLATLARQTQQNGRGSLNHLERIVNPNKLAKLTTSTLSRFQAELRGEGMKDGTIASILRHLRPALMWAVSMGLLSKVPEIHMPRRPKGQSLMRGRPITEEEFDRLLLAVSKVRPHDAPAWVHYLTGLWLSGLRLEESLALSWEPDAPFHADLTGRRPAFRIFGEAQKSGRDEILPMTPDFAQWLLETTPEVERQGRVFKLDGLNTAKPISFKRVGMIASEIGRRAGIVVNKAEGKFASCHDLRRAFGTRWAKRVKPMLLKKMMRHSSIQTTEAYYVDLDADDVADDLWANWGAEVDNTPAEGNIPGNIGPKTCVYPGK